MEKLFRKITTLSDYAACATIEEVKIAPIYIPPPVYNHPVELALLDRVKSQGSALVEQYLAAHYKNGVHFIGRDAAKRIFPEYLASPTLVNRYADGVASALADAARRTLLNRPSGQNRNQLVVLTGCPASGKTSSAGSRSDDRVEIEHETIFTSASRASELIHQALDANRSPFIHLFYTDDPRINVRRMVQRAIRIGRTISIQFLADSYLTVPTIVSQLQVEFGRSLTMLVTNNSETPDNAVHHDSVERALYHVNRYNHQSVLEAMNAEFNKICAANDQIPESIRHEALR